MINKEEQYTAIYFPEKQIKLKNQVVDALVDIDFNFSKLIQKLLKQILVLAIMIKALKKNYRHFSFYLVIKDNQTNVLYAIKELTNGTKNKESSSDTDELICEINASEKSKSKTL